MQRLTSTVAGAWDAWLTPRLGMSFRPASDPITTPDAKLGGQPVWLEVSQWPLSRIDGAPMMFVGQFPVPRSDGRIGGRVPDVVRTADAATGPTLWTRGTTWDDEVPVELHVDLTPLDPATDRFLQLDGAEGTDGDP